MSTENTAQLTQQIESMRPWHHDIKLFGDFTTGRVFSPDGTLKPKENDHVSLISPGKRFLRQLDKIYPQGMSGKSFLDCACNAGVYCFLAREREVERAVGFDVRNHWIDQANFVKEHRTVFPTDRIEFHVMDLYDIGKMNLQPFDMTYFSGIFYHLPDPITGLKLAADLTTDILVLNTAMMSDLGNPRGLTMATESRSRVMSGVHQLAWFPNSKETLVEILKWMGFEDLKMTMFKEKNDSLRARIEIVAGRDKNRLDDVEGERLI